jgi:hypothetical protein
MLKIIGNALHAIFPISWGCPPEKFAAKTLESADFKTNVAALEVAATAAKDEDMLKEFRDIANAQFADEGSRHASVIGRAQGMLVALAIFGVLLTLGSSLFTQTMRLERPVLWGCVAIVVYIVSQMFFMVVNVLQAIGGVGYPRAGSSDLTKWLGAPDKKEFFRAQALLTLNHYRSAALNNSWRFMHLGDALSGLRNIVFALSLLILTLFIAGIETPPTAPAAPPTINVIVPDGHHHHWWWGR